MLLDKLLADLIPKGRRVLIFSGFTRMLDILNDFLTLRGYGCRSRLNALSRMYGRQLTLSPV